MVDVTSVNGVFDWVFRTLESNIAGSIGLMLLFIAVALLFLLFLMKAGRFVVVGFMSVLFIGLASYGYTYINWLAGLAFVAVGLMLAFIFLKFLD